MSRGPALCLAFLMAWVAAFMTGCASSGHARRGPELPRLLENSDATYRIDLLAGHGSGVVISREGHILTAYHVVEGETSMTISIAEGRATPTSYTATVVATDPANDLAVVKIDRRFAAPATLEDMGNVHAGDAVYNIGYPYDFGEMTGRGYVMRLRYSLTSASRGVDIRNAMLVELPDGPGTSGSGIFLASNGKLIGIMRMMFWVSNGRSPPLVVRVITPVDQIRSFLDRNRIPYLRSSDVAASAPVNVAENAAVAIVAVEPTRL